MGCSFAELATARSLNHLCKGCTPPNAQQDSNVTVLTDARYELVTSSMPFLCQPREDQRKSRRAPYLRVVDCCGIVDCLRDVFLRVGHYPFRWHLLSINTRHAPGFVEHLAGFL